MSLKVSIVVPVYNGSDTIALCIESLLSQNYPQDDFEIIVVENGSTDNTTQIVKEYPVRLLHSDPRGPSPARNLGVSVSNADIIAFTDSDCIADPNWLSALVKPYSDEHVGGVGGAILAYEHTSQNFFEKFSHEYSPLVNYMSSEREFLPHLYTANASYRRELLNQIHGFNPHLITVEDVDVSWRLQLETGAKLKYAPEAVIYHYHRTTQVGLARQYRHYGFGEILLDTIYGKYPGYPRNRGFQFRRIIGQVGALFRYAASILIRQIRLITGRATPYQAAVPKLWFLVENNNIRGKLEGLFQTRFMTDAEPVLNADRNALIARFYKRK